MKSEVQSFLYFIGRIERWYMITKDLTDLTYLVLNSESTAALKCVMVCLRIARKSKIQHKVAFFLLQF